MDRVPRYLTKVSLTHKVVPENLGFLTLSSAYFKETTDEKKYGNIPILVSGFVSTRCQLNSLLCQKKKKVS